MFNKFAKPCQKFMLLPQLYNWRCNPDLVEQIINMEDSTRDSVALNSYLEMKRCKCNTVQKVKWNGFVSLLLAK